jgi:outer membrane protein assembly factor BamB
MCRMRRLVAVAVAGALALAACSGSHPTSASTASTARPPSSSTTTGSFTPGSTATNATPRGRNAGWPTYHRLATRAGADPAGPPLANAHRRWSTSVDGAVYAEPLVAGNAVIVATENNSLYALDAATGRQRWRAQLGAPVSGSDLPCGNIDPSGITGTPVVDPRAGVVYAVTFVPFVHRLVALDLNSGHVRWQRPIDPPGADPKTHQQRSALALSRGRVYVAYGGLYGDCGDYHGWVLAAPAAQPTGQIDSYEVPTAREGAIWAPSGPAIDAAGNVYVATGNGASSTSFDHGNSVIRLTPALRETSFFAPQDAAALSGQDLDLGSTGPLLLPQQRVFIIGKTGDGYLLDANNLGGIGHALDRSHICTAAFGADAYANGTIYVPCTDGIVAVAVRGDQLQPLWHQGAAQLSPILAGPGLWTLSNDGTLDQLDPHTGAVRFSAPTAQPAHFATPAAGDGRIFVAAGGRVFAFG